MTITLTEFLNKYDEVIIKIRYNNDLVKPLKILLYYDGTLMKTITSDDLLSGVKMLVSTLNKSNEITKRKSKIIVNSAEIFKLNLKMKL